MLHEDNPLQTMPTVTPSDVPQPSSFSSLLAQLFAHPSKILRLWNWKAALLSIFLRGPVFLVASLRRGPWATAAALLTESFFCATTAGFYGAIVQFLRLAQPQWLTLVFITLVLPLIFQSFEYLLHMARGTHNLRIAEIVSVCVSGISALFNWYAMRRNTLLVGEEGGRFKADLARLPRLLLGFVLALPLRGLKRLREGDHSRAV
jgi:hypothetical protein